MPEITIEINMRSADPNIPTVHMLRDLEVSVPELIARLQRSADITDVKVTRRGTLPVGPTEAVLIAFAVSVGTEITKELAKRITDDIYDWLKNRRAHAERDTPDAGSPKE
jgi:hypothetical protein